MASVKAQQRAAWVFQNSRFVVGPGASAVHTPSAQHAAASSGPVSLIVKLCLEKTNNESTWSSGDGLRAGAARSCRVTRSWLSMHGSSGPIAPERVGGMRDN
jgi:hypothetical protein